MCDYCSWIDQILARIRLETKKEKKEPPAPVDPVIIVHGGAGRIPKKKREYILNEVKNAAIAAYSDLINGCSSVDAVEGAICYMESKPYFNCAKGGSLDINNEVVTDAGIISINDGGCVGAVRDIEHPISLARKVMENTDHALIVEKGAQKLALDAGIPILPPGFLIVSEESTTSDYSLAKEGLSYHSISFDDELLTACSTCALSKADPCYCLDSKEKFTEPVILQIGAVGAAAFDRKKLLASGTSTAGEPGKPTGVVSAIGTVLGCGIYANKNGCVSVSGDDMSIYFYAPGKKIIESMESKYLSKAVTFELDNFEKTTGISRIGAIALNAEGEPFVSFKCQHFPWAFCQKGYVYYGCAEGEKFSEKVKILEKPLDCMCEVPDET